MASIVPHHKLVISLVLARDVWDNDTDSVNLIIKLVDLIISDSVPQAHYPEICLAWVMSQDTNYNPDTHIRTIPGAYRSIRINCPVDVNMYDSSNALVASIISDKVQDVGSIIICYMNNNGEKVIYLPADEDYHISVTATDDGEMTYSVSEYNLAEGSVSRLINYYNVPIINGDVFTGTADSFSGSEIENGIPNGSSVEYRLLDDLSEEVAKDEDILGIDIQNNYFNVSVASDNDSGYVVGSGEFLKGSFAKIEAIPLSGSSFLGWYDNGTLVSMQPVYRFAVTNNVNLVAKFTSVEKHTL